MIQKILNQMEGWVSFGELLKYLSNYHHKQSLIIELEMKEICGGVVVNWGKEEVIKVKNR